MIVERFAPSPSGLLHLGHAFSALTAFDAAKRADGEFLLRIEDIDSTRCKPEFTEAILEDLSWLGLKWAQPVMFQSARLDKYSAAIGRLEKLGVTYPCLCTRKDISTVLAAPQEGDGEIFGPGGAVYPGTCRDRAMQTRGKNDSVRLDMRKALEVCGDLSSLGFMEIGRNAGWIPLDPDYLVERCGDVVLARRDIRTSYHICVVVDDGEQAITHITRGADIAAVTALHVVLQRLLKLPTPTYRHHRLIRDAEGRRLAKRHDSLALRTLRAQGLTRTDIRKTAMQYEE